MELQTCSFITMKFASSTMWLLSVRRSCTRHLQPFVAPVSNQNLGLFDALVNVLPLVEGDEEAQLKESLIFRQKMMLLENNCRSNWKLQAGGLLSHCQNILGLM
ncbi:uncharacterized protein [Spinacia oleracea]|uniref:Uncharacterized protein n=1 Tax=Spinacia oleracea TaxID=3562 RepID=A0ABM3QJ67_SPIOL|nr:uncharacterized protein LOC110801543 [Spinacia oleracea]XP_056683410.1 uncharacterized protein LOC110801543 [Spinacia oleracea]XP_056683411.1 uncharacterized protein LOC110801543 [Spinacia oleracea]